MAGEWDEFEDFSAFGSDDCCGSHEVSVLDQMRTLWAKATPEDRRAFMEEITDGR